MIPSKIGFVSILSVLLITFILAFTVAKVTSEPDESCECGLPQTNENENGLPYPWLAAIVRKSKQKPFCWGALINDRYVLTVGHCVASGKRSNVSQLEIWLNDGHANLLLEPPSTDHIYNVEQIKLHPKYNLHNDIALIKLKNRVVFNQSSEGEVHGKFGKSAPACLPTNGDDLNFTGAGTTLESSTLDGKQQLVQKELVIYSNADCIDGSKYKNSIKETMICAGDLNGPGDQPTSCQGDSGNPLLIHEEGRNVLVGLASWGRDCSGNPGPAVYVRVSAFIHWISESTHDANKCRTGRPSISITAP